MPWLICGTFPSTRPDLVYGQAGDCVASGLAATLCAEAGLGHSAGEAGLPGGADRADRAGTSGEDHLSLLCHGADSVHALPIARGTPALAAAAAITAREMGGQAPYLLMAGDTGRGEGSRRVYTFLHDRVASFAGWGITFHYLLPDVDWHNRLLMAFRELPQRPVLCADAGYMYAAKMSGYAAEYDLFTPDAGELAFLADEDAPHPFYTRGFLLAEEEDAPAHIARAYAHGNAAASMLVKGKCDMVVRRGEIVDQIDTPGVPHLEPIGGTGDTVAGIATGLLAAGMPMLHACSLAARANRHMGNLAQPTPATRIDELLAFLPQALRLAVKDVRYVESCGSGGGRAI